MKHSKHCPKCESVKVGYLKQEYSHARRQHDYPTPLVPQALPVDALHTTQRAIGWAAGSVTLPGHDTPISIWHPVGPIEAFVCADCGYFESYVKAPADVEWESLEGFQWLNQKPDDSGPYR